MRKLTLKLMLGCTAAISVVVCSTTFAQGGGNGQGGIGAGNAHGAATAGMTYHGDPVTSPLDTMPGNAMKKNDPHETDMHSMSPDDAMSPAKTGQ
ncbi:hypothetical protein [Paraburkholderia elongata]|uniref:Pentapeptide MXKDX repeat protein n=1 Tax=Paraburkholderia elongata TaxID=2675747 RepID=A0A972NMR3_9BURK|nr:hypothetical protein [Paraburkholderia elongata]NPT56373.1 hypothetical protein [Paraburkholderia elongata]